MRLILLLAVCMTSSICFAEEVAEEDFFAPMQGVWFGTKDTHRFILVISSDRMLFIHPTGATASTFRLSADEIDIDRFDGAEQFGVYRVDGNKLTLTLADPGLQIRPGAVGTVANRSGDFDTAIFSRAITEGALTTIGVIAKNSTEKCLNSAEHAFAWLPRR